MSDATAKIQREKLTELQGDLKDAVTGSKAARQLQKDLIKKAAEYQTFRKTEQLRFLNQEAAIYKTIYMKVKKVVSEIAAKRGFTLVIRFNHQGVAAALDSKTILKRMNRLVVSYDKSIDITETVLKTLNDRYRLASR
ncbi:MAG: OmpH family outer membrane protein [Planctomycetes bacterium]|nr:OmpH family outer membrane protein [Planctomycetota bacterium]